MSSTYGYKTLMVNIATLLDDAMSACMLTIDQQICILSLEVSSSLYLCYHCFLLQSLSHSFVSYTFQSGYTNHTPQNFHFCSLQSHLIPVLQHPCLASIHQGWYYHCIIHCLLGLTTELLTPEDRYCFQK